MNSNAKRALTDYRGIALCILLFVLLLVFPLTRIRGLWVTVPLYAAVLLFLRMATEKPGSSAKAFAILAVVGTVVLASVYLRFLLPRKTMVSLGTAMVKGETAPKVLFIVSGLYALVTIAAFWLQYVRKTKEPRE